MDVRLLTAFVSQRLSDVADPDMAMAMARYMKTDQPFFGVQKPECRAVSREAIRRWVPHSQSDYEALVGALWELPHREEQYVALAVARGHRRFVAVPSVPLYRRLIIEGGWWDLVDEIATKLIGRVLGEDRATMTPIIRLWIGDENLWIRRSAIISQIGHKQSTDEVLLFEACTRCATETDFFIRKAIGWALRSYAWTNPQAVAGYVEEQSPVLSPLSTREALKNL